MCLVRLPLPERCRCRRYRCLQGRRRSEQPPLIISAEPTPELSSPLPDERLTVSPTWVVPASSTCLAPIAHDSAGDRTYLMLARPNVIMNDILLQGVAVAGSQAASRKRPHNHAQTARNLRRSLRNAAVGARLIKPKGWAANRLPTSSYPPKSQAGRLLLRGRRLRGHRSPWRPRGEVECRLPGQYWPRARSGRVGLSLAYPSRRDGLPPSGRDCRNDRHLHPR
jgi:hypothetical protein